MPIDVQCTACGQRMRVGDTLAGKQANCPKCKSKVNIPAATADSAAKATAAPANTANPAMPAAKGQLGGMRVVTSTPAMPAAPATAPATSSASGSTKTSPTAPSDEWHLQTADGQRYGPIPKWELDNWLTEDRIPADGKLLPPGGQTWVAAAQIYPSLAQVVQQPLKQQPAVPPPTPPLPSVAVPSVSLPSVATPGTAPTQSSPAARMPSFPTPTPAFKANPYASPTTSGRASRDAGEEIGSLAEVSRLLTQTRPWAMFIAILGFLYGGFLIIIGLIYLAVGAMALGSRGGIGVAMITGMFSLAILGFGSLVIYCFVFLTSYALRIGEFQRALSVRTLEDAIRAQRSFWRMLGIILAIVVGLTALGFLVLFVLFLIGVSVLTSAGPSRF